MERLFKLIVLALAALVSKGNVQAQEKTSGMIDYEVTVKVDMSKVKIVTIGGDNGAAPIIPDVITSNQNFYFNGSQARLEGMKPRLQIRGGGSEQELKPPMLNSVYFSSADKKAFEAMQVMADNKTYYTETETQQAEWKTSEKTKKILGYTCKKATVKLKDEEYTVWYTTDIKVNFSPIAGLQPAEGLVLSIENDNRSFVAKKIELKEIAASEVSLPAAAEKVTKQEMNDIRKKVMDDMRNNLQMGN
jgi:GLPGLI family protein